MNSSAMGMVIVRGIWLDERHQSGWMVCLLSSLDPLQRNIRLITELDLPIVSEYLVGIGLVGVDSSRSNKLAIISKSSLIDEWCRKEESQRRSLMLKSPVLWQPLITKTNDHTSNKFLRMDIKWEFHKKTQQGVSAKLESYIYRIYMVCATSSCPPHFLLKAIILCIYVLTSSSRFFYYVPGLWRHIMWHVMWLAMSRASSPSLKKKKKKFKRKEI